MKTPLFSRYIAMVVLGLLAPLASAAGDTDKPVHAMAKVLLELNHYPNAREKEKLQAIADDAQNSDAVRTIAMAIHGMEHSVSADYKAKLQDYVDNESTDTDERALAEILLGITHYPGEKAKERLKKLMQ